MRIWILIAVLAMTPAVLAAQEAENIFASEELIVDLTVSSHLNLRPKAGKPVDVEYLHADLYFFPESDATQQVSAIKTKPESERIGNWLRFKWEYPPNSIDYEANCTVKVRNFFPRVTQKIPFPLRTIPNEAQEYLLPTEHIDSNNAEIINLANRIAQGKDDLYVVVSELAIWTKNNIEYNLSTLTAEAAQKASWVLQNRQGVCDELTSLFIAMCRALGIPARFVTGVSYTSSPLFDKKWGTHGWAEVYFPGTGWIPFDPTFGEFGWVDPGHIKMMDGADPEQPGTKFEWHGNGELQYTEPKADAKIISIARRTPPIVELTVKPVYDEVGFGSYNLVQATVQNLLPYYITTELRLARVNELHVIEPLDRQVILKPREKKTLFWRIQVDPGLQSKFVYTIPIGVYTIINDSVTSSFTAKDKGVQHSKVDVTRVMNTLSEEEECVVSQNLDISCIADRQELYPGEKTGINCTLRNTGTTPLKGVSVCIDEKQCIGIDIGIGQTRQAEFVQGFTTPGSTTVFVRAKSPQLTKSAPLGFTMMDFPKINITDIQYPATIAYGKKFSLLFLLRPTSYSVPKNVKLKVSTPAGTRTFEMPELPAEQMFEIEINSDELSLGTTDIRISASYKDGRGKTYSAETTAPIILTDIPFLARIWLWLRGLFY
ncbi:MAG: transglutaminase-like domain-containing protein [Candidatus Woesearchaeota archaeon]